MIALEIQNSYELAKEKVNRLEATNSKEQIFQFYKEDIDFHLNQIGGRTEFFSHYGIDSFQKDHVLQIIGANQTWIYITPNIVHAGSTSSIEHIGASWTDLYRRGSITSNLLKVYAGTKLRKGTVLKNGFFENKSALKNDKAQENKGLKLKFMVNHKLAAPIHCERTNEFLGFLSVISPKPLDANIAIL